MPKLITKPKEVEAVQITNPMTIKVGDKDLSLPVGSWLVITPTEMKPYTDEEVRRDFCTTTDEFELAAKPYLARDKVRARGELMADAVRLLEAGPKSTREMRAALQISVTHAAKLMNRMHHSGRIKKRDSEGKWELVPSRTIK